MGRRLEMRGAAALPAGSWPGGVTMLCLGIASLAASLLPVVPSSDQFGTARTKPFFGGARVKAVRDGLGWGFGHG